MARPSASTRGAEAPPVPSPSRTSPESPAPGGRTPGELPVPRRSRVGGVSLAVAVGGAAATQVALRTGPFVGATWLEITAAGFEAAVVGGLADWFAVTALFRHPLGLPIPHTNIIIERRQKLIDGIVTTIENDWLAPQVISAQLERFAPGDLVVDWLRDPEHVQRLSGPLRDVLRALVRMLDDDDLGRVLDRMLQRHLAEVPIDRSLGRWLEGALAGDAFDVAFASAARSIANLADRPRTASELQWWFNRSARKLREHGKRLVPFFLRRRVVQRKLIEAVLAYASTELRGAAEEPDHPVRGTIYGALERYAGRLAQGDPDAIEQTEKLRATLLEGLESGTVVRDSLTRLRRQLEDDLEDPASPLSRFLDQKLRAGILDLLEAPERRAAFDRWVRQTAKDLVERHHHAIGLTVRENLESRAPEKLVRQIEDQVGADLQYIRLNGALVGGLIGLAIALAHWAIG